MKFSASLDGWGKFTSFLVTLFFVIITIATIVIFLSDEGGNAWSLIAMPILLIAVFLITYSFRPLGYEINNHELTILRPGYDAKYTINSYTFYETPHLADFGITIRLFAAAAFWGYFGIFYSFKKGSFTAYCSRFDNLVLLEIDKHQKIVLSPDDVQGFLAALAKQRCRPKA